ncbi:MAG: aminomethyl-transferring glycine dehydrogenase subunit GcvPA, partial [Candidatus Poribacteria bacterium]
LDLPDGLSEMETLRHLRSFADQNANLDEYVSFLGAGAYDHFIPAVVGAITSRGEFATAYTPYQPEVSQGTLQAIFEYQSLICALTDMDVANASLYDGASATAEAALLALNAGKKRDEIVMVGGVHPEYRETVRTYLTGASATCVDAPIDASTGTTDLDALRQLVSDRTAGVIVQQPNFYGALEPTVEIGEIAHAAGALYIANVNPISLALVTPPGAYGADVVVGEGQPLGNDGAYGGPYLGFFAVTAKLMRRTPGRLVGETSDVDGKRANVLTLRAREQDIRREKATSNICTNQSLNALAACVYMCAMGKQGIQEVADLCLRKAHYLRDRLCELPGVEPAFSAPYFHEFALRMPGDMDATMTALAERGFLGGVPLGRFDASLSDCALLAVTERRTREEMDRFVAAVAEVTA